MGVGFYEEEKHCFSISNSLVAVGQLIYILSFKLITVHKQHILTIVTSEKQNFAGRNALNHFSYQY